MAREGDADCRAIVGDLVHYLAIGIGNMVNLLDPDRVVICGAIEVVNEELLTVLRREVRKQCLPQSWQNLDVRLSKHAERSALLGAAVHAAQNYINSIVQPMIMLDQGLLPSS
jgi:glucokinase